jgi:hypothetical protein
MKLKTEKQARHGDVHLLIPALSRLKKDSCVQKANMGLRVSWVSLGYVARPCLKK